MPLARRERDNDDLSNFIPEVLDIYTIYGKVYSLPMLTTGSFIFYNRDLFDAAGVEYPPTDWDATSWTHDAFVEKCGQLTSHTDDPEMAVLAAIWVSGAMTPASGCAARTSTTTAPTRLALPARSISIRMPRSRASKPGRTWCGSSTACPVLPRPMP